MFFINKKNIPLDCMTTYARFVCTYRAEKEEKNRTRLTVGGNIITDHEGDVTTNTAGLELIKIHWCSVLSSEYAKYMTMYIVNFYLNTTLGQYQYMRINVNDVPQEVIDQYKLYELNLVHNKFVFVKIQKTLFGLKQSGVLFNKQLSKVLVKEGYFQSEHMSGL